MSTIHQAFQPLLPKILLMFVVLRLLKNLTGYYLKFNYNLKNIVNTVNYIKIVKHESFSNIVYE